MCFPPHAVPPSRNPTLNDIAAASGFSKSAVSAALNGRRNVPLETRNKIAAVARELGYCLDPQLSKLMSYLRNHREVAAPCNVAWVYCGFLKDNYILPWNKGYLQGANERALELGLNLDLIWLDNPDLASKDITQMLLSRGVEGIIIAPPWAENHENRINWSLFTCVFLDQSIHPPYLHHVMTDYFKNMSLAVAKTIEMGYRRPAYLCSDFMDLVTGGSYSAAFDYARSKLPENDRIPRFDVTHVDWDACVEWIAKNQPDVLIVDQNVVIRELRVRGISVPRDLGVIHTNIGPDVAEWSGIDQCHDILGVSVVEALHANLIRGEKGLPSHVKSIEMVGKWHQGTTTRSPLAP